MASTQKLVATLQRKTDNGELNWQVGGREITTDRVVKASSFWVQVGECTFSVSPDNLSVQSKTAATPDPTSLLDQHSQPDELHDLRKLFTDLCAVTGYPRKLTSPEEMVKRGMACLGEG